MTTLAFLEVDAEDGARVRESFPDAFLTGDNMQQEGVAEAVRDAEVISCFIYSKFGKRELDALPNLKLLCTRSVGYDHIDLAECRKRNITVCNVPDYGSHVIAEHVFALLLSATRHIAEADARVESGNFDYHGLRGMSLKGKTIGVAGTGKIGRRVCKIAHGFGMRILAFDKCRTLELEERLGVAYVDFDALLSGSDVLTLHLPANDATGHMLNADTMARMKDGAVLINTARGSLIDTNALVHAVKKGKFSHVLLDVLEHEKNFEENRELISLPQVLVTPHIAFFADESMRRMFEETFTSIDHYRSGSIPSHAVEPVRVVCDLDGLKGSEA